MTVTLTDRLVSGREGLAWRSLIGAAALVAVIVVPSLAMAEPARRSALTRGLSAFSRGEYASAARIFIPMAEAGNPSAQAHLGFLFETGRGVPQNYTEAAMWFRRAAEQGDSFGQYSLGLLYDRGQGVPRDIVEASKWLNLAAAGGPTKAREARVRIRDAVSQKMTRGEIAEARMRALGWAPMLER